MPRGEKFEFTDDQINHIVANWGEESAHSMKKKFGCSWYAICGVAKEHGLDMPESEKWTDEQVKELMEMSDKMHYEKIAKLLGKTKNAIYLKARKLNITLIQDKRTWTKEELEYLTENWGVHSINYLAKKLKHSINAVKIKAYRLGLGATMDNTDFLLVSDIIEMLGISRDRICGTWVDLGLKLKKHNVSDKKFYYCIKLENLIAFLKDHQDEWDSRKLDMYMLGAEEEWLVEKRKKDIIKNPIGYRKWNEHEINIMISLFNMNKSYEEIAEKINRSENAVAYKLRSMGYSYRMPYYWSGEELLFLKNNYIDMQYCEIAEKLGRTEKAVAAKAEEMGYCKKIQRSGNKNNTKG